MKCRQINGQFKPANITGIKFGRLTAINISHRKKGKIYWNTRCECGNTKIVAYGNLQSGEVRSCGCLRRETAALSSRKHGMYGTRLYECWNSMHKRCRGTSGKEHNRNYHGRGIRVCSEWSDFKIFMAWAVENGYSDKLTIDREENDKGYSPDNCRWITIKEQQSNRRTNHLLTFNGETKTCSQWAEQYNMKLSCLYERLRRGWNTEKAITKPVRRSIAC